MTMDQQNDLATRQAQIADLVRAWTSAVETDVRWSDRFARYCAAVEAIRNDPDAAAYMLSIWYQPEDVVASDPIAINPTAEAPR